MVATKSLRGPRLNEKQVKAAAVKLAESGSTDEASFEQAFSSIAHAYLRNRAPSLLDHELGFQLLDSTEDKKKAIGIMAFKVGSQTLYAPVFFLNGELKGHELTLCAWLRMLRSPAHHRRPIPVLHPRHPVTTQQAS